MNPQTDQQLLASYLQGSPDAFRSLVDRYAGLIFSTASRIAPPALAEDITQAVFILLANRAHTLRNPQLLPAWLLKVTHYCAADARRADLRRKHHEQKAAAMATSFTTDPPSPDPLEPHLDAALQSLSPPDRTALLLRFYNDHSLAQIAASLSISEEAAKKRVARALEKLRKLFLRKGTTLALPLLATTLAKQASAASPALTAKITTIALTKSSAATSATLIAKGALKLMAYTTAKWTAATVASLLLLSTLTAVIIHSNTSSPLPPPPPPAAPITLAPAPETLATIHPTTPAPNPITVEVRDLATNLPLEGVQVQLQLPFPGNAIPPSVATTSDQGTLSLPIPPAATDSFHILARKPGYVPAETYSGRLFPNDPLPTKFSLQLEKATTIGGKVLDDQGTPLASALVEVIIMKQYKDLQQNIPWNLQTMTNANGEWTLNAAPEQCDSIQVAAFHESCVSNGILYGPEIPITDLRNRTAITTLKHGTPIHALVKDYNGKPCFAWIGLGDQRIATNAVPEFTTAKDGSFDFVPTPDAPFFLTIHNLDCAAQVVQFHPNDPQPFIITLQPRNPLLVRILDSSNHPIPNAHLTLDYYKSQEGRYLRGINKSFLTSDDGLISWPEAFNETLYVNIAAPGYLSQSDISVTPGESNDITLFPRFIIHTTVIDDDTQQPAANFRLIEGYMREGDRTYTYTDLPDWESVHVRQTGPGTRDFTDPQQHEQFVLRALGGDYEPANSEEITTDGRDQSTTIHLHHGKRLAGTLLDQNGNPLPNTIIMLQTDWLDIYDAKLPTYFYKPSDDPNRLVLTDAKGQFSFSPQQGNFALIAGNDAAYVITKSKVFLQTHTLHLTPYAKIEGTLFKNGNPAPNSPVSAYYDLPALQDSIGPFCHFNTTTDSNGHFTFPKIFAGPISLGSKKITTKPNQTSTITVETTSP